MIKVKKLQYKGCAGSGPERCRNIRCHRTAWGQLRYTVVVRCEGKTRTVGTFHDEEEAIAARNKIEAGLEKGELSDGMAKKWGIGQS